MRIGLPLKLGFGVILLFAVVIAGMFAYRPLRYYRLRSQLLSPDKSARDNVIKTLAADGEKAIPYLRRWLKSGSETLIIDSCRVLTIMKGGAWLAALPELLDILQGKPSRMTDAAAALIFEKVTSEAEESRIIYSLPPEKEAKITRNFQIFLLNTAEDDWTLETVALNLGVLKDPLSVEALIGVLEGEGTRSKAAAAAALGLIGDPRGLEPVIAALENSTDDYTRMCLTLALIGFESPEIENILLREKNRNKPAAEAALAWLKGGEYLDSVKRREPTWKETVIDLCEKSAEIRWGNISKIEDFIEFMQGSYPLPLLAAYFLDIIVPRLPDNFPWNMQLHSTEARRKQSEVIREWYEKHKPLITWDKERKRYRLREPTEPEPKKAE